MKANAPIFYILSQIGVFCIVYTLLLASHRTSFAIDFCAPDFATRTALNASKVALFAALIHAPGLVVAHRFADIRWSIAALPLAFAQAFVTIYYGNDIALRLSLSAPCLDGLTSRSIFRPDWSNDLLQIGTRIMAYGWGLSSLFVLYKTSKVPSDLYED